MEKLAGKFGLSPQVVQQVLDQAATALGAR
jgi:hypothetical protein